MTARYVAFEGIEGAGKSTVASAVAERLHAHGVQVRRVREPGGTGLGEQIRTILLDPAGDMTPWAEAMLFAAARSELAAEVVGPALTAGEWVLSDRSVYSSLAYQGGGRDLGVDLVRAVNEAGLGGVWPHLVVLLRLDVTTGLSRQDDADRIGGAGADLQQRVADTFDLLAEQDPGRFVVVDATRPLDHVVTAVTEELERRWLTH